jgi:hypothetical protein
VRIQLLTVIQITRAKQIIICSFTRLRAHSVFDSLVAAFILFSNKLHDMTAECSVDTYRFRYLGILSFDNGKPHQNLERRFSS